jgi:hypothetical protein
VADAVTRVGLLDRSACRKDAAERFSTARMVASHLDLYGRAIGAAQRQEDAA